MFRDFYRPGLIGEFQILLVHSVIFKRAIWYQGLSLVCLKALKRFLRWFSSDFFFNPHDYSLRLRHLKFKEGF